MSDENLIYVAWGLYGRDMPWGGSSVAEIREKLIDECGTPRSYWGFAPSYTWTAFRNSVQLCDDDIIQSGERIEFHRPPKPITPPDPPRTSLWQHAKKLLSRA